MVDQPRERLTSTEFFEVAENADERLELINGEIMMSPTPTPTHQDIVGEIYVLLREVAKSSGGRAFVAPLEVVFDADNTVQPDVIYLTSDSHCTVGDKRLHGVPELVVEVLSPGSQKRDRKEKHALYEQHAVGEYWLVDPDAEYIEVWRTTDDTFTRVGIFDMDETFTSTILADKTVEVKAIFNS